MKKLFVGLALMMFVGTVSASVYAFTNQETTVVKKDHDDKKKKCDKKDCCKKGEAKTCDKSAEGAKTCDKSAEGTKACCQKGAAEKK
jgi:hypothetical protein